MVECDASEIGIGVVLIQDGLPIAFVAKGLAVQHRKLSAYEKELIGLAKAICHWRTYIWRVPFLMHTDHYSLKFLLEHCITTSPQQRWISKLLGLISRWTTGPES